MRIKLAQLAFLFISCCIGAHAQVFSNFGGMWCQKGGQTVLTQGLNSTTTEQASYPQCTVSVYLTGTVTLATGLFSNAAGTTPLSNPFTSNIDGSFLFFISAGCYDVVTSGGLPGNQFPAPFTYTDMCVGAGGGGGAVGPCPPPAVVPGPNAYFTTLNGLGCDQFVLDNGSGTMQMIAALFTGTNNGFAFYTFTGTDPPLAQANSTYLIGPATAPASTIGMHLPNALAPADLQYGLCQTSHAGQYDVLGWCLLTTQNYILQVNGVTLTNGDTVNLVNSASIGVTKSTNITTDTVSWYSNRTCMIVIGADNGATVLASADIAPQKEQCQVNGAATILEIDVTADTGTSSVVVAKRHCTANPCASNFTVTALLSSALATAASGGPACAKATATAGYDTFTTCAATLQNTALGIGDYIETSTATADGIAHRFTIAVHFQE